MPLAASLVGATGTSMVRADVALAAPDGAPEAVVGSFTVDGLTYAVDGEGQVALVAVAPLGEGAGAAGAAAADGAEGPSVEGEAAEAAGPALDLPGSVAYAGTSYSLVRIAPLALAACGAASLAIPASVTAVDTAAALGCETLERVAVDKASDSFTTFDGYLTDKACTSILLVPEGRVGQLRIASTIQDLDPRVFSHCARLSSLDADAGCPGLASWDGSLYTPDLSTLLRVPAGAEAVTLPPECSAIGASALSGCTALRAIEAQGSVTSIAPSAFGEVEEAQALPAAALGTAGDEAAEGERPVQLTGLVAVASSALSSIQIDKSAVTVTLAEGASPDAWQAAGFTVEGAGAASANADADAAGADDDPADPAPEGSSLAAAGTLAASIISEDVGLTSASTYGASSGSLLDASGEEAANWTLDAAGTLTISGVEGKIVSDGYGRDNRPWQGSLTSIKKVVFDNLDVLSTAWWFQGCTSLASIEVKGERFLPSCRTMLAMFHGCTALSSISEGFSLPGNLLLASEEVSFPHSSISLLLWNCKNLKTLPATLSVSHLPEGFRVTADTPEGSANRSWWDCYPFSNDTCYPDVSSKNYIATQWNGKDETRLIPSQVGGFTSQPDGFSTVDSFWRDRNFRNVTATGAYATVMYMLPAIGDELKGEEASYSAWAFQSSGMAEEDYAKGPYVYGRDGLTFMGWFTDKACTKGNEFDPASLKTLGDDITVYGKFTKAFAISYMSLDEGGSTSPINAEGSDVTVDPPFFLQPTYRSDERVVIDAVPVREGYEFLGWTIEGITGDEPQKQAIIPKGTTGDLVAVAHWAPVLERHYLITTADAAVGYTVDNFPVATGVSSPKAWWTLDDEGELRIHTDEGATISEANFAKWINYGTSATITDVGAWGAISVREKVKRIVLPRDTSIEQRASWTLDIDDNASIHAYYVGMAGWFANMRSLTDISGVEVPEGITSIAGLFYSCWSLSSFSGAYGTFEIPDWVINTNCLFSFCGIEEISHDWVIPSSVTNANCMFEANPIKSIPGNMLSFASGGNTSISHMFYQCWQLAVIPEGINLNNMESHVSADRYPFKLAGGGYTHKSLNPAYVSAINAAAASKLRTFYAGDIANLYPGKTGQSASATVSLWASAMGRTLVSPADLVAPQSAVRFQVPKEDGSGYVEYDVLTDASGRVSAPAVTRYGYSKVAWRYDTGTTGDDLGRIAAMGPCGAGSLSFDASALPEISPGLKGPVYAEVSGLMLSMDMPVGSGNLWYAIDCGEVIALGPSASARAGMADAHELSFESYTPVPTELCATFTANDAADGVPSAEKLFPSGIDEATGFSLVLDGGASVSAGFKGLIDSGGSQGFESLASLDASASVREPGRASGTLALKLGGANATDFAEETTEYSVAEVVWTLDASAQYDLYAADDAGVYGTSAIKDAADAIAAFGASDAVPAYRQYHRYLEQQSPDADPVLSIKVYDQPDGSASTHGLDVLGIAQDTKTSGGKAGLTFGWHDIYARYGATADGIPFDNAMYPTRTNAGGWLAMRLRARIQSANGFIGTLGQEVQAGIVKVNKRQQNPGALSGVTTETVFVPSVFEVLGSGNTALRNPNETTANSFQYQYFAKGGQAYSTNGYIEKSFGGEIAWYWTRSAHTTSVDCFTVILQRDVNWGNTTNTSNGFVPCFAF